eukprot:1155167-Pelagomonas_calceolata.AAC.3
MRESTAESNVESCAGAGAAAAAFPPSSASAGGTAANRALAVANRLACSTRLAPGGCGSAGEGASISPLNSSNHHHLRRSSFELFSPIDGAHTCERPDCVLKRFRLME